MSENDPVAEEATIEEIQTEELEVSEDASPEIQGNEESEEEKQAKLEEHRESSRLGRKFKGFEDKMSRIEGLLEKITQPAQQTAPSNGSEFQRPEIISTPEDVELVIEARERKREADARNARTAESQSKAKYEKDYLVALDECNKDFGVSDEEHENVIKAVTDDKLPYGFVRNYGAVGDAKYNYSKALLDIRKNSNGANMSSKQSAKVSAQPSGSSAKAPIKSTVKLPEWENNTTRKYVEKMRREGVSDAEISKMLQG